MIFPYVGCVVSYSSIDQNIADREWILWDKKGNTVLLVENYGKYGPRNQMIVNYSDCEYVSNMYSMNRWHINWF